MTKVENSTPRSWRVELDPRDYQGANWYRVVDANGNEIAYGIAEERYAVLIVRAVNRDRLFEEAVGLLQEAYRETESTQLGAFLAKLEAADRATEGSK